MNNLKTDVKNMELVVSTPKKDCYEMTLNNQIDLTKWFFDDPYGHDDGVIRSLLCDVSHFLQRSGVESENIQAGLLIYIALNSVRLGFPISVILKTDELTKTRHLLNVCKQIAPKESFREVQELKYEQLYNDKKYFEDKVIICQDTSGVKKAMPDLLMLLTQGYATRQENYKSRLGSGIQEGKIQYSLGFIGIELVDSNSYFDHPSIIKISVGNADRPNGQMMPIVFCKRYQEEDPKIHIECRRIGKVFERMRYQKVDTRYLNQTYNHIRNQQPVCFWEKINVIIKVLSLITIMNHPDEITPEELISSFINYKNTNMVEPSETLTATEAEYFITTTLLNEVITIKNDWLTVDEFKVFEAVKSINFGKLRSALTPNNNTSYKLWLLINNSIFWAKKDEIFKQVNETSKNIMALPVIEKALQSLIKMSFISAKRIDGSREYGYFIVVPEANGKIKLPHPSMITNQIHKNQSVQVVNPLTGGIENI